MQSRWAFWISGILIMAFVFFLIMVLWLASGPARLVKPCVQGPGPGKSGQTSIPGTASEWAEEAIGRLREEEYLPRAVSGRIQAANRAQDLKLAFTAAGVHLSPRGQEAKGRHPDDPERSSSHTPTAWQAAWTTVGFGRTGAVTPVAEMRPKLSRQVVEYHHPGWTEWYRNTAQGVEQGFRIDRKPECPSGGPQKSAYEVQIIGRIGKGLTAAWLVPGQSLKLEDSSRITRMLYQNLAVKDAKGKILPCELRLDQNLVTIAFQDAGAAYPVVVDPLLTSPSWTADGGQLNAQFATSVAAAGDVNGDGYMDVIIGVPFAISPTASSDAGMACVYYGSANGLAKDPDWRFYGDQGNSWLGFSVAPAGDVNHDGYADVIVGAPYYDVGGYANTGRAYVFHGSANGLSLLPARVLDPNVADPFVTGAQFGYAVSAAGDVNGDSYGDVLVGAPYYHAGEGCFMEYDGSGSGINSLPTLTSFSSGNHGCAVACAGDVNHDGYSDIIVGSECDTILYTNQGSAMVMFGSAGGLTNTKTFTGSQANEFFGHAVSSAGDVNHDGYDDVIVGAPGFTNDQTAEGKVYVYHGGPAGPGNSANWEKESHAANSGFGRAVNTAGDVNCDGCADIIIGSPYFSSQGKTNAGKADIYYGSANGLEGTPAWSVTGDQASAGFGCSVAGGDVNHDHYAEAVTGASFHTSTQDYEGRAFLFANPTPSSTPSPTPVSVNFTPTPVPSGPGVGANTGIKAYPSRLYPGLGGCTTLRWQQSETGPVTVRLYTLSGRLVATLADRKTYAAGDQEIRWTGQDDGGQGVAAGIYLVQMQSGNAKSITKVAVIK